MSAETHSTGLHGQDHQTSDKPPRRVFIYAIRERETGRQYVGSALDYKDRWRHHRWLLNANKHHCVYLQRAWNKHGCDRFEFVILEILPSNNHEIRRIAELSWIAKCQHYNSLIPSEEKTHFECNDIVRMRISAGLRKKLLEDEHHRQQRYERGKALAAYTKSSEGREAMSKLSKKRWQDPKEAARLRQGLINRWADPAAKERQSIAIKKSRGTKEGRQRYSKIAKMLWADPNSGLRNRSNGRWATPITRKMQSEAMKVYWAKRRSE